MAQDQPGSAPPPVQERMDAFVRVKHTIREQEILWMEADQLRTHAVNTVKDPEKQDLCEFMGYKSMMADQLKRMKELNEEILHLRNFVNENDYIKKRQDLSGQMLKMKIAVAHVETAIETLRSERVRKQSPSNQSDSSTATNTWVMPARKLETLKLEKFDGTIESWIPFWTRFEARVHGNDQLTTMEKYDYLRQYSNNSVLQRLKTIPLKEEFYETAVQRLQEEFGTPEKILSHYTTRLMNLPHIDSQYDIEGLRAMVHLIQTSTAALETVGMAKESVAPFFWPVLRKALPVEIYLQFKATQRVRYEQDDEPHSSSSLSHEMSDLVEFLRSLLVDMSDVDVEKLRKLMKPEQASKKPTLAALAVSKAQPAKTEERRKDAPSERQCIFCEGKDHWAGVCKAELPMEKKKELLLKAQCCFRCTKPSHRSKDCKSTSQCPKCERKGHAPSVCRASSKQGVLCCKTNGMTSQTRNYMTALVNAYGPSGKKRSARVLFDTAAQSSFISTALARAIGFDVDNLKKTEVGFTMLNKTSVTAEVGRVELRLQSREGNAPKLWIACHTLDTICEDGFTPQLDQRIKDQLRSRGIKLADEPHSEKPIEILIGLDHMVEFQTHEAHKLSRTLEAVKTALGWTLFGCNSPDQEKEKRPNQFTACLMSLGEKTLDYDRHRDEDRKLEENFRKFVEAEATALDDEQKEIKDQFHQEFVSTKIAHDEKNNRFTVRLPFKEGLKPSENRKLCMARLRSLEARLDKNGLREKYDQEIRSMLELGFLEKVTRETPDRPSPTISYLPHREVIRSESLTTKLRIVFDASAKERQGLALNEALETGPNLHADMLAIILNFRRSGVTLLADIQKAFPQIIVHENDRDALRILWDLDHSGGPQTFRLTRNSFGLSSSPYILAACIGLLLEKNRARHEATVKKVQGGMYVDDLVLSLSTEEEAIETYESTRTIFEQGSFQLRKWLSNSQRLMRRFQADNTSVEEHADPDTSEFKVLGLRYSPTSDTLRIEVPSVSEVPEVATKRSILSAIASVFDRVGLVAPVLVRAKIIMQSIYKLGKMHWDDPVPRSIQEEFAHWLADLRRLADVRIPRQYSGGESEESRVVVHCFGDACSTSYGIATYVVIVSPDGKGSSSFLLGKSRVAPMKNATIPRLELMALTLSAETCDHLKSQLRFRVDEYHLWTDNSGTFYWATSKNPEKLPMFVRNRVRRIQNAVSPSRIHFVPGHLNPSDIVSRGCTVQQLLASNWLTGPDFITKSESEWPEQPEPVKLTAAVVTVNAESGTVIEFARFSTWKMLKRTTVRILRFADFMKKRTKKTELDRPITAEELDRAERHLVRLAQEEEYAPEIESLRKGKHLSTDSKLRHFHPLLEQSLLLVGGRLSHHDGDVLRNPIILPPKHKVTRLVLTEVHVRNGHAGVNQCLVESRKKYWIPRGRQRLQSIIFACLNCRRFHAKPMTTAVGDPPRNRVTRSAPFAHVGTDVAGPVFIKTESGQRKVWISLFTCCATRAVHVELLDSLSTKDFMLSLRRFRARRGTPRTFYSDNAKAYKRAADDLQQLSDILEDRALRENLAYEGISWKWNCEKAAWMNGFVERMVGILKTAMKKTIGKSLLDYQELQTVLYEIENFVNRRPLCQVSDSENFEVLTPLHFLIVSTEESLQDSWLSSRVRKSELLARWRRRKQVVEDVWKRWEKEYLALLRNFHQKETGESSEVTEGRLVIIEDKNKAKLFWLLGRVESVNVGRDGVVRSCKLKLANGRIIQRPVKLLYPLEIME